jgi:hypothetical protein
MGYIHIKKWIFYRVHVHEKQVFFFDLRWYLEECINICDIEKIILEFLNCYTFH